MTSLLDDGPEFIRAGRRVLAMIARFQRRMTQRDMLMMQIGMRASHIEEALAKGEIERARLHFEKLTALLGP